MANEQDPIQGLVAEAPSREDKIGDDAIRRLFSEEQRDLTTSTPAETPTPDAPITFQQGVEQGFKAGIAGLQSSGQYFKALVGVLADDDKMVADSISKAARYDAEASQALGATAQFKEFWDSPTFDGGIEQTALALGQVAPTAVLTIASALATGGTSVLGQLVGKEAIAGVNKYVVRRVIKEATENVVNKVATPDEKTLVESLFRTFKTGARTGAFGSSFVPLAGQNFSEGLQSGRAPDADLAIRSLLVATPQAAVDIAGEELLLRAFTNTVKNKAKKDGGVFANLATTILKGTARGTVTEGTAEGIQETIAVANRMDMDETYSAQDAKMRIAQGVFMGAIGGGGVGGATSTVGGSVQAVRQVFDKAQGYLDKGRELQTDQVIDEEQYGDMATGYTTQEPEADITAQLNAMFNTNSSKRAVWIAGEPSPKYRDILKEDNTPYEVQIDGKKAVIAHIPGRGVIISTKNIVDAVIEAQATDESLQVALGYSNTKPQNGSIVVQALDESGRIVSEEVTDQTNLAAATAAATALSPNSTTRTLSLKDALADRKRRLDAERGPVVTPVQGELFPEDAAVVGPTVRSMDVEVDPITGDPIDLDEDTVSMFDGDTQGEFTEEVLTTQEFAPRNTSQDAEGGFANTQEVRNAFAEAFGDEMDIDFNTEFYDGMSESLMRRAIELKNQNPDSVVSIQSVPKDEKYELSLVSTKNTEFIDGRPIFSFLLNEIRKAKNSKFASDRVQLVQTVDGKQQTANVNLVDLINAGKRLNEVREGIGFEEGGLVQSAKNGLASIMSELINRGYDIKIDGKSIFIDSRPLTESDVRAVVGPKGVSFSLKDLFARPEGTTSFVEAIDASGKSRGSSKIDSSTEAGREKQAQTNQQFIKSMEKRFPELGIQLLRRISNTNEELVVPGRLKEKDKADPIAYESSVTTEYEVFRQDLVPDENSISGTRVVEHLVGRFSSEQQAQDFVSNSEQNLQQLDLFKQPQSGFDANPAFEIRRTDKASKTSQLISGLDKFAQEIEDNPEDGLPLTRLNLEDDPRYQNRARGGKPGPTSPFKQATYPAGSIGQLAVQVLNRAVGALKLMRPVSVFGVRELSGMSLGEIRNMFNDNIVSNAVIEQLTVLRDNPSAKARYVGFDDAHFILVDNRTGSELEIALAASHELGHALFEEERNATLTKPGLRVRLERAFDKAKNADGAPEAYQGDLGFEEWYADQVAIWALRNYMGQKKAEKNLVESYFNKIAKRIVNMFKAMSAEMRRRFGAQNYNAKFDTYIEIVVANARRNRREGRQRSAARSSFQRGATYKQKAIVRALNEAMPNRAVQTAARVKRQVANALRNPRVRDAFGLIGTADGVLRNISPKIANMFYTLAQGRGQGSNIGFIRKSTISVNKLINRAEKILGTNWDTQEVQDALDAAASDTPTSELTGKALQVRQYLERIYDEYIQPTPGNDIRRRENYWPVALDLQAIYNDPETFIEDVIANDPNANPKSVRTTIDGLVALQQHILEDGEITIQGINPAGHIEKARLLTANLPADVLSKYTLPPKETLVRYVKHIVKRVEFNRATKDANGNDLLGPELAKLSPEDRAKAKQIIDTYLGYNTDPLSPLWRDINSWGQFLQMVMLLPLATLSSMPEIAGAIINAKEFSAVTMAFKELVNTIKNRQEAMEFARDLGVTSSSTMSNVFITEAEAEFLNPTVRNLSDGFFKYIGLDFFTKFTREFAANMAVSFVLTHAHNKSGNPRSTRYLEDLGLTADEVKAWESDGRKFTTETGRKVEAALQKFVESSMLRPNAAERPSWASDPRWALIWQLKGYFYSFGKVTLGGIKREMGARTAESGSKALPAITGIGALALLTAVAYLPLAMLGLELREYAKYGIASVLPGVDADANRYFKSDSMDWAPYLNEVFDRSGLYGPLALLTMAGQQAEWGQSGILSLLGPSAEMIEDVFRDGWKSVPNRLLPVYNIVY